VSAGSVSIAAMFMAGILPGILVGVCIMIAAGIIAAKKGYGQTPSAEGELTTVIAPQKVITAIALVVAVLVAIVLTRKGVLDLSFTLGTTTISTGFVLFVVFSVLFCVVFTAFRRAFPSLLMIVIIIGGILRGIFTATEAAAVSVAYAFVLCVLIYREIPWKDLPGICLQTGITTAVVMLLIGSSSAMSWIMTVTNIPQSVSASLMSLSENPVIILLTINALLLVVGMFMDMTPAILIFTPILLPVVRQLGLSDIHFGIILIANLCIGLCTPPVGTCLFIGCGVGKTTIAKVTVKAVPFFLAMLVALMLIIYIPWISLAIPKALGMLK